MNAHASCGSKLPIVEPGKNPTRGMPLIAIGNSNGLLKSAATGSMATPGYSLRSSTAWRSRKSAEMSTGT